MSEKGLEFVKEQYEKHKAAGHPAAKHLKKIIDNPDNPTNVLKNGIHAHCYECSHDSADPAGSHPKKCTSKECPFHIYRPGAKPEKKEVAPELAAKRAANAEKARAGRKMTVKEALELIEK